MDQWFYIHYGRTLGPVTADELRDLAAAGALAPTDRIWRQHIPPEQAVQAGSVLVFFLAGGKPAPPRAFPLSAPAPEWLRGLIDAGQPLAATPEWVRDLQGAGATKSPSAGLREGAPR